MTSGVRPEGPACPVCGSASYRAVRMHRALESDRCYVVAIRWACCQCGLRFTDPMLDEFNTNARIDVSRTGPIGLARTSSSADLPPSDVA